MEVKVNLTLCVCVRVAFFLLFNDATWGGLVVVVVLFRILIERPVQNGVLYILITHT